MKMNELKPGLAVATMAAALFAAGATLAVPAHAADDAGVKCTGVNSCKGTSECKTAKTDCKGKNGCKGQGWVTKKSEAECTAAGGKVAK
jgi:hypothetical protein